MKKFLKIFFLILFLLVLAALVYPVVSYFLWQKNFQTQIPQMKCTSNITQEINLDSKFKDFVLSSESVTSTELSEDEVLTLLKSTNILNGANIQNICLTPSKGVWTLYLKITIENVAMPWIRLDIAKDEMETAQLYVKNIYIGGFLLPEKIVGNIKTQINKGISDALTLVNENNFIGRKIQNIELLDSTIVVKGALE